MSVYVQIDIPAELDKVWLHTQDPTMHQRWDLRFTKLDYLEKVHGSDPQRFTYQTRLGFGINIEGVGESIADRTAATGARTSSLKFGSADPRSLILEGAGYWKYEPTSFGTRFTTGYDYETRFGVVGMLFDRAIFRPLIGWATAWSFDSLRIWVIRQVAPELSFERAVIHAIARITVASLWLYQGLIPKLLSRNSGDLLMTVKAGVPQSYAQTVVTTAGWLEILFGIAVLIFWRNWRLLAVQIPLLLLLTALTLVKSPEVYGLAFNPFATNLPMMALAGIGWYCGRQLPTARNCRRRREKRT